VNLTIRDRVAYLSFDRPKQLNSITEDVIDELAAAIAEVAGASTVVALVIRGTGKAFCVGLDLDLLDRAFDDPDYFKSILHRYGQVLRDLEALQVPVIAVVNGITRAGGFELMLASDLVVAAEEARIGDVHTSFGVMPGGGSTQRLPRKIGDQKAKELILTARWLSAVEAQACGLVLAVTPLQELASHTEDLLDELRLKPASVLGAVKRAMRRGADLPLDEALDVEIDEFLQHLTAESSDSREGFRAFREDRAPNWQ
jgi:enoyl-CoA hydratase/carnithine racemase